mgnify:CR=1 FL=1
MNQNKSYKGYCPICDKNWYIYKKEIIKYTIEKKSPHYTLSLCPDCLKAEYKNQYRSGSSGKKPI